jgi:hypothetical protein
MLGMFLFQSTGLISALVNERRWRQVHPLRIRVHLRLRRVGGRGRQRVLRPVVLRVAAAHVLADVVVGVLPEVGEVLCDLDGAPGGREAVQRERHAAVGEARDSRDPLCVTPGGTGTTCLLHKCLADGPPCVLPNSYRPSSTALPPSRHCARLGRAGPAPYHVRPISGPPYTW